MMHNWMWGDGMYGYGMGWGWFGPILMIVFWGLVILGIVYLVKAIAGRGAASSKEETPLDILKKRYARGEIDAEEFARRRKDLES
ncbi:MAG: SHOCT domain-containing protein [Nitrospirae bacterium]|nr:SHOCT domain-containing protein [Nitrospirota bacterium]MDA8215363.1 SHOCT domain-containing protein [Nitrospiraceae bacterium]MDA8339504.1 SHOCT domain-containing protein [Nitrospiraceae bacterium]